MFFETFSLNKTDHSNKYKFNPTPDFDSSNGIFIPNDLDEAILELKKILSPIFLEEIQNTLLDEFLTTSHLGLGQWIRHNWGLCHGSRLANFLSSHNLGFIPDEMSDTILTAFWKYLNQTNPHSN